MINVVHCKRESNNIYIGRPSPLGNPFPLKKGEERGSTIQKYKDYFYEQIENNNIKFIAELNRLLKIAKQGQLNLGCWCDPNPCHGDVIKEFLEQQLIHKTIPDYKVLECSSKGDKRFSAFYAKIDVYGDYDSIENHYQLSKRFGNEAPSSWKDAKGKTPTHFHLKGFDVDINLLSQFYKVMWVKYLDEHQELVEYASQFDDFNDMFKGKSTNCQADVVKQYVKEGRKSIFDECIEFIEIMKDIKKSL